jgi:hypothetical protein
VTDVELAQRNVAKDRPYSIGTLLSFGGIGHWSLRAAAGLGFSRFPTATKVGRNQNV